jgi:putative RecB family exonuclease
MKMDYSKVFSFSKLDVFEKCKKHYFFNYLDPEISPRRKEFLKPRDYNIKGQAVHGAITLFYYLPKKKRTFEELKRCLKEAWYSETDIKKEPPLGTTGGFCDLNHERKTYKESLENLWNFYNLENQNPNLFFVPVKTIKDSFEDYEKMIQPLTKKIMISGKFDRIDQMNNGNLRIIDFKTGKNSNGPFQLEFYKFLAELNFDNKVDKLSYYYLSKGKIKDYDAKKLKNKDIKEKILEKIKAINKTKEFRPHPSRLCHHCDFMEICSASINSGRVYK